MSLGCTFLYLNVTHTTIRLQPPAVPRISPSSPHSTLHHARSASPRFSHHKKLRSIGYLLRWGLTLKTWQVNKGTHKRPHTVGFHVYEKSGAGKSTGTEGRLKVTWGGEGQGEWLRVGQVPWGAGWHILELDGDSGFTTLNLLKTTELYTLQWWILCKLYPNFFKKKISKELKLYKEWNKDTKDYSVSLVQSI